MQRRENDKENRDEPRAPGDNLEKIALDPNYVEQQAEFETRLNRIDAHNQAAATTASLACISILLIIGFLMPGNMPHRGWLISFAALPAALSFGCIVSWRWLLASRFRTHALAALTIVQFLLLGALALIATKPFWYLTAAFFIPLITLTLSFDRWSIAICGATGAVIYLAAVVWPAPAGLAIQLLLVFFFLLFALVLIYAGCERRRYVDHQIAQRRIDLEQLATRDLLTGCLNQRGFQNVLKQEVKRSRDYQHILSLMFVDIDFFKQINDEHGHLIGDDVLEKFGALLKQTARRSDLAGRTGGDELAILVPETSANSARVLADRIQANTQTLDLPVTLSLSIGIGEVTPEDASTELLYQRADQALYQAKRDGRGRIAVFEEATLEVTSNPHVA